MSGDSLTKRELWAEAIPNHNESGPIRTDALP